MKNLVPYVTDHAVDRAIARDGGNLAGDRRAVVGRISRDVVEALAAGRSAKTVPRWLSPVGHRKKNKRPSQRYVWNAAETRVYVVEPGVKSDGRRLVVVTTLTPDSPEWTDRKIAKAP